MFQFNLPYQILTQEITDWQTDINAQHEVTLPQQLHIDCILLYCHSMQSRWLPTLPTSTRYWYLNPLKCL